MIKKKTFDVGQELLSNFKFYSGYSKYNEKLNKYETWDESVDRVFDDMHGIKFAEVLKSNPKFKEYYEFAKEKYKEKYVLASQRSLQFGGAPILKHNAKMYNCFDRETKFVTSNGVMSFNDFNDGDETIVITHKGNWKKAVVRSYGKQELNEITFKKGTNLTKIKATANHRWILKNGEETTSLNIGDNIYKAPEIFNEFNFDESSFEEKLYWCYGYVFGDGTCNNNHSHVRLCGNDAVKYEQRFTDIGFKSSSPLSIKGDVYVYTGKYLKTTPNPEIDSPELIRAFVAGYLSADGTKSSNESGCQYLSIQASDIEHIDFIRQCFPIAGVFIVSETDLTNQVTNYGVRPYTINFRINDSAGSKYNAGWKVENIEKINGDIVWCLEVEDDMSFILSNGIVTGNCITSYCDRVRFFQDSMYWLLCGCGVGFSVQNKHIARLPKIKKRGNRSKVHVIEDSIEGWSDAIGVLLSSYFEGDVTFSKYQNTYVSFDFSEIRPKGALISGGFKAPGSDGIRKSIIKIEELLERELDKPDFDGTMSSIVAYDIVMHMSDAVLSGGVRRSATICLFSSDDKEMLKAKTGNWFIDNPQRARSNNTVLLNKNTITKEEFAEFFKYTKEFGEPGFGFTESEDIIYNPCFEIGMFPQTESGQSGFQGCNLVEINGNKCNTEEEFYSACKASGIIGTMQASYTDFKYVDKITKEIFEREALLGCSITGFMNNPEILLNPEVQRKGAEIIKEINKEVAAMIGIRQAARTTCVKPSGNASVLLKTASGIHGEHSEHYIRNVQVNMEDDIAKHFKKINPKMFEKSVWSSSGTDWVISFPITVNKNSIFKEELIGTKLLDVVKLTQENWVEYGTNVELCTNPTIRHNVSNTVIVDDWKSVEDYIFDNKKWFSGISLLPLTGDKDYNQAPFTSILTPEQLVKKYRDAVLFASGLIVDGLTAFNSNLWLACDTVMGIGEKLDISDEEVDEIIKKTSPNELWKNLGFKNGTLDKLCQLEIKPEIEEYKRYLDSKITSNIHNYAMKKDWVRRAKQFSERYFVSNKEMTYCLKDVNNYHKWLEINRDIVDIDWTLLNIKQNYVNIDSTGAVACSGNSCEIV